MTSIDPIALDAVLLRTKLPEFSLRQGASVVARVASRGEGHGVLVLGGVPLTATLPDEVGAGETLKLTVAEVTPERVTLRMEGSPLAAPVASPTPSAASSEAPPARVAVEEPPQSSGPPGEERTTVALSFDSPALGRLDLRLELGPGGVQAAVVAPVGAGYDLAEGGASALRDGLTVRTGLPAAVRVLPRRAPLDLYA